MYVFLRTHHRGPFHFEGSTQFDRSALGRPWAPLKLGNAGCRALLLPPLPLFSRRAVDGARADPAVGWPYAPSQLWFRIEDGGTFLVSTIAGRRDGGIETRRAAIGG